MSDEKEPSPKHKKFADEYMQCWNATRAYMAAYPGVKETSARRLGCLLLANVSIKKYMSDCYKEQHATVDEVLAQLGRIVRADPSNLIDDDGVVRIFEEKTVNGKIVKSKKPETKFIHKIKQRKTTKVSGDVVVTTEIELQDQDASRDKILRVAGAYKDNLNLSVENITVRLVKDE
jgi:phage terminase small subunit